jgi:hypothetical protein
MMLVDDEWVTIDSSKLRSNSLLVRTEMNASIWDAKVGRALRCELLNEHLRQNTDGQGRWEKGLAVSDGLDAPIAAEEAAPLLEEGGGAPVGRTSRTDFERRSEFHVGPSALCSRRQIPRRWVPKTVARCRKQFLPTRLLHAMSM